MYQFKDPIFILKNNINKNHNLYEDIVTPLFKNKTAQKIFPSVNFMLTELTSGLLKQKDNSKSDNDLEVEFNEMRVEYSLKATADNHIDIKKALDMESDEETLNQFSKG